MLCLAPLLVTFVVPVTCCYDWGLVWCCLFAGYYFGCFWFDFYVDNIFFELVEFSIVVLLSAEAVALGD